MASYVCVNGAVTPKIFIGGLAWETSGESAKEYFSKWGQVVDVILPKNRETGRSRGFGFVTFADQQAVENLLRIRYHHLQGRRVEVALDASSDCTPLS